MLSRREAALQALLSVITNISGVTVERESAIPEKVPAGGLVVLRDGDPGKPEITLSPVTYHYDHVARLDVVVQDGKSSARAMALDALLIKIGLALAVDRTLGGTCEWAAWEAPVAEDIPVQGGAPLKAASVAVTLSYSTSDPLNR
ncbi:Acyl-CoA transferase [Azospirillaceae bacterium]